MTPLIDEYYFDVREDSIGFLEVRLYRRNPNAKWWQREYTKMREQPFLADEDGYDVAVKALNYYFERLDYAQKHNQNLVKYQGKTRVP